MAQKTRRFMTKLGKILAESAALTEGSVDLYGAGSFRQRGDRFYQKQEDNSWLYVPKGQIHKLSTKEPVQRVHSGQPAGTEVQEEILRDPRGFVLAVSNVMDMDPKSFLAGDISKTKPASDKDLKTQFGPAYAQAYESVSNTLKAAAHTPTDELDLLAHDPETHDWAEGIDGESHPPEWMSNTSAKILDLIKAERNECAMGEGEEAPTETIPPSLHDLFAKLEQQYESAPHAYGKAAAAKQYRRAIGTLAKLGAPRSEAKALHKLADMIEMKGPEGQPGEERPAGGQKKPGDAETPKGGSGSKPEGQPAGASVQPQQPQQMAKKKTEQGSVADQEGWRYDDGVDAWVNDKTGAVSPNGPAGKGPPKES